MPYSRSTQAPPNNGAGVVFRPNGDTFHVWDNDRDNKLIHIYFNYAGVTDKWRYVGTPSDGGQGPIKRNVSERYKADLLLHRHREQEVQELADRPLHDAALAALPAPPPVAAGRPPLTRQSRSLERLVLSVIGSGRPEL